MANQNAIQELQAFFDGLTPGAIADVDKVARLLADCWCEFDGHQATGMKDDKLCRMEDPEWSPPTLTFKIERHGGTVNGSGSADVYDWRVDLHRMTVIPTLSGRRRLSPAAKPVRQTELQAIAEEIVGLIQSDAIDPRLRWKGLNTVTILLAKIFPTDSGVAQTIRSRRLRLRSVVEQKLAPHGWAHTSNSVFARVSRIAPEMPLDLDIPSIEQKDS